MWIRRKNVKMFTMFVLLILLCVELWGPNMCTRYLQYVLFLVQFYLITVALHTHIISRVFLLLLANYDRS